MPKVSVIIPTHSRPQLLPRAVESAQQAGSDVEVIVVDDASSDETAQVCKSLQNIKYIRLERNQHTAGARNIGITESTTPYISFLDDDDWRLPGTLDLQSEVLDKRPELGFIYGQVFFADQQGNIIDKPPTPIELPEGDIFWNLMTFPFIPNQSVVFRKSCLNAVGMIDTGLSGTDDWDIWIRISELFPVAVMKEPVAVWRQPTLDSQQGTSNMTKLLKLAAGAYSSKWSQLPRFKNADSELIASTHRKFAENIGEWMLDDVFYTNNFNDQISKLLTVFRCFPSYLYNARTYKMLGKKIASKKRAR